MVWTSVRLFISIVCLGHIKIADVLATASIALAFELLTPTRVCRLFSCALRRPVRYVYSQTIDVEVSIPNGYREQLLALEVLFGKYKAPYFSMDLDTGSSREVEDANGKGTVVEEARALWPGWRGIEEYAREVFVCAHGRHYWCSFDADEYNHSL